METPGRPGNRVMRTLRSLLTVTLWLGLTASIAYAQQGERLGWLGIQVELTGVDEERGLPIRSVLPGGPGARADLTAGDVILEIEGVPATRTSLEAALSRIRPGDRLDLLVDRRGAQRQVTVLAAPRPRVPQGLQAQERMRWGDRPPAAVGLRAVAGAEFRGLDPALARYFGVERGLLVLEVAQGTPAQISGLEPGDVVKSIDDQPVHTVTDLRRLLLQRQMTGRMPDSSLQMEIIREGVPRTLELTVSRVPHR